MTYNTHYLALQNSLTRYPTRVAFEYESTHLFCVIELKYWRPLYPHKTRHQFLPKNSSFSKLPAATFTCRFTYLTWRSCSLSSRFCDSIVFEIFLTFHSYQLSSILTASSWEETQFLPSSLLPSPFNKIALNLFPLPTSKVIFTPLFICCWDSASLRGILC